MNIRVNLDCEVVNGKQISFRAPCDSSNCTGLVINDENYDIVDSADNTLSGKAGLWKANAIISVIVHTAEKRAYLQNPSVSHVDDKNNPHGVTAEQIGAFGQSNVTNWTGTDLNDFKSFGAIICTTAKANSPKNTAPYATVWNIAGFGSAYLIQHYFDVVSKRLYYRGYIDGVWSAWTEYATADHTHDYLPLAGGIMTGQGFYLNNKTGRIVNNANGMWLRTASSDVDNNTDSRHLKIWNATYMADLAKALCMYDTSTGKDYNVYGTHNITKGTSALTAGSSALGNDCIYLQYE